VSASGAEERSSSLRGGAFRAMNNQQPHQEISRRSISTTVQHLFIAQKDSAFIYWILGAITLIGLVMRIWKINEPIAYDEAYTFIYFATKAFRHVLADYSAPNNHIFHTILVHISYQLFGGQTWIVRLPALIAGILSIPAAFFAARRIFSSQQSLAAAALVALTPWFISYSTNGRGYTLLTLFALLLANLAGLLVRRQSPSALAAFAITAALGFYTIPIFLYPMAGICLWVLATYLVAAEPRAEKLRKSLVFAGVCALTGLLVLLLYSPVIFFGTGLDSIINNEIVESRDWSTFVQNVRPRAAKTWESWMFDIAPPLQYLLLVGFLVSVLFYRKASRQRLPLQLFLLLAILIVLAVQRVAPLPRVWIYLEMFYMLFAGAGLAWLAELGVLRLMTKESAQKTVPLIILASVVIVFTSTYLSTQRPAVIANRDRLPEQQAADYLASHLQPDDTIISIAPVDIRTAYYLYINGIPYDVFYQRDHPVNIRNAIVILRTTSKYNTAESLLDFYNLTSQFDLEETKLVYEYGPLSVFSIPVK
jgi:4-amino-4-deoxy-L-arabinose transferase-like glycosyltransferase